MLWSAWQQARVTASEAQFREAYVTAERQLASQSIIQPDYTFRQTLTEKVRIALRQVAQEQYLEPVVEAAYSVARNHTARSRQVLSQLADSSQLALVSNFYGNIHTVLAEFGMSGLFSHVVESATAGVRKPDPRIFRPAIEALGRQPEGVTVVGDSIGNDIKPARLIGCQTVWIRGEQWTDGPVDESVPHRIISDIEELLET